MLIILVRVYLILFAHVLVHALMILLKWRVCQLLFVNVMLNIRYVIVVTVWMLRNITSTFQAHDPLAFGTTPPKTVCACEKYPVVRYPVFFYYTISLIGCKVTVWLFFVHIFVNAFITFAIFHEGQTLKFFACMYCEFWVRTLWLRIRKTSKYQSRCRIGRRFPRYCAVCPNTTTILSVFNVKLLLNTSIQCKYKSFNTQCGRYMYSKLKTFSLPS